MWWKRQGVPELRRLLMDEWDPIGVAGIPEAADEYDSYLGTIVGMLRDRRSTDELRAYLHRVRTEYMGLSEWPQMDERERALAERLVAWYAESMHG